MRPLLLVAAAATAALARGQAREPLFPVFVFVTPAPGGAEERVLLPVGATAFEAAATYCRAKDIGQAYSRGGQDPATDAGCAVRVCEGGVLVFGWPWMRCLCFALSRMFVEVVRAWSLRACMDSVSYAGSLHHHFCATHPCARIRSRLHWSSAKRPPSSAPNKRTLPCASQSKSANTARGE